MNPLLIYFLKVNIAIVLFYLFYRLFFANDTLWKIRRWYLMSCILLAGIYPLFPVVGFIENNEPVVSIISEYVMLQEVVVLPEQPFDYMQVLSMAYGIVSLLLLVRLIVRIISILHIRNQGQKIQLQGINIISIDKNLAPFSFFGDIYINPAQHSQKETGEILTHELTHVRQMHSADVLFAELLTIICWLNPASWLMKREIRQNLEYLADDHVLKSGFDSRSYQYHLLQLSCPGNEFQLTNQFNISPLKKRIAMMNQQKTPKTGVLKYLMVAPLFLALVVSSNAETLIRQLQSTNEPVLEKYETTATDVQGDHTFTVVEKMPSFPGGDTQLVEFLKKTIQYPVKAQEAGTQGRVICQFVIEKDGSISEIEIVRSVDPLLDAEAVRVIGLMPKWTPGTQRGQAVRVKYTMPINFALKDKTPTQQNAKAAKPGAESQPEGQSEEKEPAESKVPPITTNETTKADTEDPVFIVVEKMPSFPGGSDMLFQYLNASVSYPVEAHKNKVQGRVICQFVINKDGSIDDVTVVKSVDPHLDAEAIRVIKAMPEWTPGMQRGKTVRVKYTLPINFKLQ